MKIDGRRWLWAAAICLASCAGQIGSAPEAQSSEAARGGQEAEADSPSESIWREQKLIRNGDIHVEVSEVEASARSVAEIAARHDGIVADSRSSRHSSGQRYASISVRVPAAEFDATLAELRGLGVVQHEGVSTQDVTKAYFDLETRLGVKRGTAERIRELLKQRTGTLADVLAAESELSRVTEDIEQLEGEKRFYDHRIATSTIEVSLAEAESVVLSLFDPVGKAFRDSGQVLGGSLQAMVYLVTAALPWALVALVVWWLVRRFGRRARTG